MALPAEIVIPFFLFPSSKSLLTEYVPGAGFWKNSFPNSTFFPYPKEVFLSDLVSGIS